MTTVKFDISQADEVAKYLGVSIEKVAERAILATAIGVVARITTVIIPAEPRQPVDRGAYRAAWRAKKVPGGAQVQNLLPYAAIIEYGARAQNIKISAAMIKALAEWVIRKGIVGRGKGKAGKAAAQAEAISMAWAIAKSMKKRGIFNGGTGLRVLEKALKGVQRLFAQELKAEIQREYK